MELTYNDFIVSNLGKRTYQSPLGLSKVKGDGIYDYVKENDKVLLDASLAGFHKAVKSNMEPLAFEKAGPLEKLFFNPLEVKAAIVTCGGLCPGLNDVIRGVVMQLDRYGIKQVLGVKYGYAGFIESNNFAFELLDADNVDEIQHRGGTILGSSRGNQDIKEIVNTLVREGINLVFCVGGDGTQRGAYSIYEEITRQNLKIAIVGIPKTIDNDINFIERSFGFETAFSVATEIIENAHNEAKGAYNGIALIKLMGRDSGFIAAHAALAQQDVNIVIVPEMEFDLYGEKGLIEVLKKRLENKHHAVVVVAEGAGQFLFDDEQNKDASGNILHNDIGILLKDRIIKEFKKQEFEISLKYIDPSYIIRSANTYPNDSMFCNQLAQNAVHAAMAGKTGFIVGNWNGQFTNIPIPLAVKSRKKIDLESDFWGNVVETTRQPISMKN